MVILFDDGHFIAGIGSLECCGHTGKTTAHDKYFLIGSLFQGKRFGRCGFLSTCAGHSYIVLSRLVEQLGGLGMRFFAFLGRTFGPNHLLAQISTGCDGFFPEIEFLLHDPGGTGGNNEGVDTVFLHIFFHEGTALGSTEAFAGLALHGHFAGYYLGECFHIEFLAYAAP